MRQPAQGLQGGTSAEPGHGAREPAQWPPPCLPPPLPPSPLPEISVPLGPTPWDHLLCLPPWWFDLLTQLKNRVPKSPLNSDPSKGTDSGKLALLLFPSYAM